MEQGAGTNDSETNPMIARWSLIILTPNAGTSSHVCQGTISLRPTEILKTVYQAHDDGPASSIKVIRARVQIAASGVGFGDLVAEGVLLEYSPKHKKSWS